MTSYWYSVVIVGPDGTTVDSSWPLNLAEPEEKWQRTEINGEKYVYGVANSLGLRTAEEQNRTRDIRYTDYLCDRVSHMAYKID